MFTIVSGGISPTPGTMTNAGGSPSRSGAKCLGISHLPAEIQATNESVDFANRRGTLPKPYRQIEIRLFPQQDGITPAASFRRRKQRRFDWTKPPLILANRINSRHLAAIAGYRDNMAS